MPLMSKLVQPCKDNSMDTKAVKVTFRYTSAKYEIVDGLSFCRKKMIVESLKKCPFLINMDESTTSNRTNVFTIIASYLDEAIRQSVVKHYYSFECVRVIHRNSLKKSVKFSLKIKLPLAIRYQV